MFKKSQSTETLGVALVKLLVLGYLLGSNFATDMPIYVLSLVIGVYQIFSATNNLVTYVLYCKNNIRLRFRLLLDGLLLVFLGGTSLLASTGNSAFQLFLLWVYFFLYSVLYFCDRDKYIDLCKRESKKILFAYGIDLTPEMEKAVQKKVAELKQLTIPWEPSTDKIKTEYGTEDYTYAYKIKHEKEGELYKFIKSKFKSYFVLSKGFIAPGIYHAYLDRKFKKPNSIVVCKHVY